MTPSLDKLNVELGRPVRNRARIARLWDLITASGSLNGAVSLAAKVTAMIRAASG